MAPRLFHFSEDPTIDVFAPHVPASNPTAAPAVWAIDEDHSPLYWFPRDCPRVAVWPWPGGDPQPFRDVWGTSAPRVHAIEDRWSDRMRSTTIYRYEFAVESFERWPAASGHWVSRDVVRPIGVVALGDLVDLHTAAGIELRTVLSLWPLIDLAQDDRWDFSIVRKANLSERPT